MVYLRRYRNNRDRNTTIEIEMHSRKPSKTFGEKILLQKILKLHITADK